MILLERYMKKLKGFLQQRPKLEGSMAKGYIIYKSVCYASEYIKQCYAPNNQKNIKIEREVTLHLDKEKIMNVKPL
jgi:hypothetical protein